MLRRQKHALSQSTTPFACTLIKKGKTPSVSRTVSGLRASKKFASEDFHMEISRHDLRSLAENSRSAKHTAGESEI